MPIFEAKFGFLPKKNVKLTEDNIYIGKNSFYLKDIQCIYFRPFNFVKNEWGGVYFSLGGEEPNYDNLFAKNVFNFTNGQTSSVKELFSLLDIEVIEIDKKIETYEQNVEVTQNTTQTKIDEHRAKAQNALDKIHAEKIMSNKIICTNCGSTDVEFMGNNKKSFSAGKAVAGTILTGGVGALAGFTGKKGKNQWFCKNCNTVFETKSK